MVSIDAMKCFYTGENSNSVPIDIVFRSDYKKWKSKQPAFIQNWIQTACFKPKPSRHLCIPNSQGCLDSVLAIADQENTMWALSHCPHSLPEGHYHIATAVEDSAKDSLLLRWGMGSYQYQQYKRSNHTVSKLSINNADEKIDLRHC